MDIIYNIVEADKKLLLLFNGWHNTVLDTLMFYFSNTLFWTPLYLWLIYLLHKKYKKEVWIVILCAFTLILFTDQTANVFKALVQRLRPTHDPEIQHLVHTVNHYRGGMFGFFSSHAANAFGLVTYCLMMLKPTKYYIKTITIFYACLTSYSRIYLGVHFPIDIIAGIICGVVLAFLFYNFTLVILGKWKLLRHQN